MSKTKIGKLTKRRWSQAGKLAAVARVNEGAGVKAVAEELNVRAELLHDWYRRWRSGGPDALRAMGRPSANAPPFDPPPPPLSPSQGAEQRRIAELERKIGRQQLELDFFRAALRHVGEQRLKKG